MRTEQNKMPSTSTLLLLAAAGAGAYYAFGRPITEVKPVWVEPKHANQPWVTNFIKPDDVPAPTVITSWQTNEVISAPKYKPDSFMDRYIKKRGFPPGW